MRFSGSYTDLRWYWFKVYYAIISVMLNCFWIRLLSFLQRSYLPKRTTLEWLK